MTEPTIAELNHWAAERCGYMDIDSECDAGIKDEHVQVIPDYCGSLDAAWALAVTVGAVNHGATLWPLLGGACEAEIGSSFDTLIKRVGHTPAEALVRAVYTAQREKRKDGDE